MAQKTTLTLLGIYGPVTAFLPKTMSTPAETGPFGLWRGGGHLPLALLVFDQPGGTLLYDWTLDARNVRLTDGERGYESLAWSVEMSLERAYRVYDSLKVPFVTLTCGFEAWEGRIEDKRVTPDGLELGGFGSWRAISDYGPYNALWSDSSTARWEEISSDDIATVTDVFKSDNNNRVYIAPNKGGSIASGERGGRYYRIPDKSLRNMTVIQFSYQIVGSSKWKASLRRWASSLFGTPTEVWSPTLTAYNTYAGAVFATFTGSPLLTLEFESQVAQTTLNSNINAINTTLAPTSLRVNTTSGTAVAAPGTVTITPAAMTNIVNGMKLLYGAGTINLEKVTVSNVTGTTFDATFKNTHLTGVAIKSTDDWAVPEVDTTTTGGHAAGSVTITPATMANIVAGMKLIIGWGGEAEEEVTVASVTATTFNCTLVYGHPSGDKIRNGTNTYTVRPQSMTGIEAGMNLDIGGRNSEVVNVASVTSTTFTADFKYGHPGDSEVTTARRQTVTPVSMTDVLKGRTYFIGEENGADGAENVVILETTVSTFTAEFTNAHAVGDTVKRIYSGDYDAWLKVTDLRVATATTHMVNTTVASSISSGVQVVTPASMANISLGQHLVVDGTGVGDLGEMVMVTAVTDTTFTADFALAHSGTITVKGIAVYASEIAQDITTKVATLNPDQLSDSLAGIQATSRDLVTELYEEVAAQDVLGYLAEEGDDDKYEVGVWDNQRLFFRERGSQARVWYTDVVEMELGSTLDTLTNQVYSVYRATGGGILRTASADSAQSQARYDLIRRGFAMASTTSQTQAEAVRDAHLTARNVITPRIGIVTQGLFDAVGTAYPLWMLRAGDELILQNLPVTLGETVDKVRRFRVKRKTYDASRHVLQPVPELELPGLDIVMTEPMIKAAREGAKTDRPKNPATDWAR